MANTLPEPAAPAVPDEQPHGFPQWLYWLVYAALLLLTAATTAAAYLPMPRLAHVFVALAIAATKAILVVLVFMHVWHALRATWLFVFGGLYWLGLLIGGTLVDYLTRD